MPFLASAPDNADCIRGHPSKKSGPMRGSNKNRTTPDGGLREGRLSGSQNIMNFRTFSRDTGWTSEDGEGESSKRTMSDKGGSKKSVFARTSLIDDPLKVFIPIQKKIHQERQKSCKELNKNSTKMNETTHQFN